MKQYLPRPPKGSKKWNPPNKNPLLHWGNKEIIRALKHLFKGSWGSWHDGGPGFKAGGIGLQAFHTYWFLSRESGTIIPKVSI